MSVRETSDVRDDLHALLKRRAEESNGVVYLQSKAICDDLDSSSKQVGNLIRSLADEDPKGELDVSKWGRTSGITWEVRLR